ncbi:hypothetical protein SCOR_05500 [Sulfidibacter corallicola]|uniref:Poly-gamma-glutamate synthase PgsB/CapB n=1 Tax=Sulfidibacter corallicola TaxID=2818388 RepID=A0A8A4TQD9_SULCO|nr:hypothetical protein [Sulfidibacter corallicola]QTD51770.1 hypothetical protein J3U87_04810 [Sulfidibacter corallicola]
MKTETVFQWLSQDLSELELHMQRPALTALAGDFLRHREHRPERDREPDPVLALLYFLRARVQAMPQRILQLNQRYEVFSRRYHAATAWQRRQHLLDFARDLGADRRQLKADARAIGRHLDHEALGDRYRRRRSDLEHQWVWLIGRLGALAAPWYGAAGQRVEDHWYPLSWEQMLHQAQAYRDNPEVVTAAFEVVADMVVRMPVEVAHGLFDQRAKVALAGYAGHGDHPLWARCACLRLVATLDGDRFMDLAYDVFATPDLDDMRFLRARVLSLLPQVDRIDARGCLVRKALEDPSEHVRQACVSSLVRQPLAVIADRYPALLFDDEAESVAGRAVLGLVELAERRETRPWALRALLRAIGTFDRGFPATAALAACVPMVAVWRRRQVDAVGDVVALLQGAVVQARESYVEEAQRRKAGMVFEALWCEGNEVVRAIRDRLRELTHGLAPGKRIRIPREWCGEHMRPDLVRILAVLVQDDYGFDLEGCRGRWYVRKGPVFGFRWWRWWHELTHPATDKRQGHRHTVGRLSFAETRVPSGLMAECSPTKVPGEPLLIAGEGDWRPFLPLPDDVLSCLDLGMGRHRVQFHCSEGLVTLTAPERLWSRVRAAWKLTRGFAHYARLRNWQECDGFAPNAYAQALRKLGFHLSIESGDTRKPVDSGVARFFAAATPAMGLSELWTSFKEYAVQIYENQLWDLTLFCLLVLALFLARHAWSFYAIRRARKRIGLVIGGWGTRGKSGTERLKAALFNAMGKRVFSKTTGCEARFIFADTYGRQWDLPLFRPHGKASIWEQGEVVKQAAAMGTDVFLWECMGLTPEYVRTLQRGWMRDDLATITNTYPDHEDLQGPSGWDVARTISMFIPERSRLFTSETQMKPLLETEAARKHSQFDHVGELDVGLLPQDLLDRFPYAEHPNNIALVLRMAEALGRPRDWALKAMADRVVPDVGVLKQFAAAPVEGRRLVLINGMSANERLGALTNWRRLGFDKLDPVKNCDICVTLLVNNREDRVARSQVFAQMLVRDMPADHVVLVGSNLRGMQGFIDAAWQSYRQELSLWDGEREAVACAQRLARRFRLAVDEAMVRGRLAVQLAGLGMAESMRARALDLWNRDDALAALIAEHVDADRAAFTMACHRELMQEFRGWSEIRAALARGDSGDRALEQRFFDWVRAALVRRLTVIDDPAVQGGAIIQRIHAMTPIGMENRILGVQNIKGPGLAVIERFQKWEETAATCALLQADDRAKVLQGLSQLQERDEVGFLGRPSVAEAMAAIRLEAWDDEVRRKWNQVHRTFAENRAAGSRKRRENGDAARWLMAGLRWFEALFEAGQAVKRRRRAQAIYRDLADERIGYQRAITELTRINRDQEPDWLYRRLTAFSPFAAGSRGGKRRRLPIESVRSLWPISRG